MAKIIKSLAKITFFSSIVSGVAMNILFPKRCPYCDKLIGFTECSSCEKQRQDSFNDISKPIDATHYNLSNIRFAFAPLFHNDFTKTMLSRLKFNGDLYILNHCINLVVANLKMCNKQNEYDFIVCVPTRGKEHKNRDNIPLLLAKGISKQIDIPFNNDILFKSKETQRQTFLSSDERHENVIGAFDVKNKELAFDKRFLIVDDVLTTGSTANDCARALIENNAKYCDIITIFVSQNYKK